MAMAMAMDALMGWPAGLFARIGHPVTWLGALINVLDARSNRHADAPALRRASGIVAALFIAKGARAGGLGRVRAAPSDTSDIVTNLIRGLAARRQSR
jgi:adenosylcobinamide-phosphate synthase